MLLAAGEGIRLRPITEKIPKCMIKVGGKPILEWNINWLRRHGLKDIVINLYHMPQVVRDYFGDGKQWGVNITYSLEETILGTAGGVKKVACLFDDTFLVWYGDNICTCDLTRMNDFHRTKGGYGTIALHERDNVTHSGIVGLDDRNRIIRFLEKPKPDQVFSHWVNAGIYILERSVIEFIPDEGKPDFGRDVFPSILAQGYPLYGYRMSLSEKVSWIDTKEDLKRVEEERIP